MYNFTQQDSSSDFMNPRTVVAASASPLLAVVVCGCSAVTEFVGESVVAEDGSLTRHTRYIGCTTCQEGLTTNYELPAGGTWDTRSITTLTDDGSEDLREVIVYEMSRDYGPGVAIPSDFGRRSASSRVARNSIAVARRHYFLLTTFRYDEEFRDVQSTDEFRQAVDRLYDAWLSHAVDKLLESAAELADTAAVRHAIASVTERLYKPFLDRLIAEGAAFMNSDEAEDWFDPDTFHVLLGTGLSAHGLSLGQDDEDWESRVNRILNFDVDDHFSEEEWAEIEESLFGAHGLALFSSYAFAISVRLPGTLYETNASERNAGLLRWSFNNEEFLLWPYTISARSYVVHPLRIGVVVVLIVFVAAGVTVLRSRRRLAQS